MTAPAEHPGQFERWHVTAATVIRRRGGFTTVRDLAKRMRRFRRCADAQALLEELVTRGWGSWFKVPAGPRGGRPTSVFALSRRIDDPRV